MRSLVGLVAVALGAGACFSPSNTVSVDGTDDGADSSGGSEDSGFGDGADGGPGGDGGSDGGMDGGPGGEGESGDGSGSSTGGPDADDCIDDPCVNGTCVDELGGFTCACDDAYAGELCDEVAAPFCLRGTITVEDALDVVNGTPATLAFEHLEGDTTDFLFVFDVTNSYTTIGSDDPFGSGPEGQLRVLDVEVQRFESSDTFLADQFGAAYVGSTQEVILANGPTTGVSLGNLVSPQGVEYWGLETFGVAAAPIVVAPDGFPELFPSEGEGGGSVALRRYQNVSPIMTDYASSTWTFELLNGSNCDS